MTSKQMRVFFRYLHIVVGSLLIAYVYSSTLSASPAYTSLLQFVIIPFAIMSGVVLWQQPRINKWRKRLTNS